MFNRKEFASLDQLSPSIAKRPFYRSIKSEHPNSLNDVDVVRLVHGYHLQTTRGLVVKQDRFRRNTRVVLASRGR